MYFNSKSIFIIPTNYICTTCWPRIILHTGFPPTGAGGCIIVCTSVSVLLPDHFLHTSHFHVLGLGLRSLVAFFPPSPLPAPVPQSGGVWVSIVFNNALSAAIASFWAARSLRSSAMMAEDALEVPVLAMILVGGEALFPPTMRRVWTMAKVASSFSTVTWSSKNPT